MLLRPSFGSSDVPPVPIRCNGCGQIIMPRKYVYLQDPLSLPAGVLLLGAAALASKDAGSDLVAHHSGHPMFFRSDSMDANNSLYSDINNQQRTRLHGQASHLRNSNSRGIYETASDAPILLPIIRVIRCSSDPIQWMPTTPYTLISTSNNGRGYMAEPSTKQQRHPWNINGQQNNKQPPPKRVQQSTTNDANSNNMIVDHQRGGLAGSGPDCRPWILGWIDYRTCRRFHMGSYMQSNSDGYYTTHYQCDCHPCW